MVYGRSEIATEKYKKHMFSRIRPAMQTNYDYSILGPTTVLESEKNN